MAKISKSAVAVLAVLLSLSVAYDFWQGYHRSRSIANGVIYVLLGFCLLGLIWFLVSRVRSS